MTKNQTIALALVGGAIAALLFCAFTKEWFGNSNSYMSYKVGLRSATVCAKSSAGESGCESKPLGEVFESVRQTDDALDTWLSASNFTFVAALVSAAALLLCGVFGFIRHPKVGVAGKITLLILIGTIVGAVLVLAKKPPELRLNASWGVFLFMAGGMAGVIGAYMLSNPTTYEEVERDPDIPRL